MGVDLGDLASKHTINLASLSGKIIAIDAFNIIYQFLASIRQEDGTPLMDFKGNVTAHLSGLFYRNARLLENGIRPIYVFDGKPPSFKGATQEARAFAKAEAEKKWKKALEEERLEDAKKYAQATSKLTREMVGESKQLLEAMGIPVFQAPSEGEAQAAYFVQQGAAYATASQDYDALLFGSPVLLRNISITGRRKVPRQNRFVIVEPEEINLEETLRTLGITHKQLILLGILVGTDFNEGVQRVGPKTALKIVKEHTTPGAIKKYVQEKYQYEFEEDIEAIIDFFLHPPIEKTSEKFSWPESDETKVRKILCEEHDFNEDRIQRTLEQMLKQYKEKTSQSKLEKWF
ncbi:MAG TPA: flap endonuclease-1 [Candidatus Bilamarchaeaceae archaeon]|nr:flap endonuclease-1 [Candidatus Bilamarchaeaceae archaeon]